MWTLLKMLDQITVTLIADSALSTLSQNDRKHGKFERSLSSGGIWHLFIVTSIVGGRLCAEIFIIGAAITRQLRLADSKTRG